ncbi:hypothetical protein PAMA_003939 [Pampus argenteus]
MTLPTSASTNFTTTPPNTTNIRLHLPEVLNRELIVIYILIIVVLGVVFNIFVLTVFCMHKKPCTVAEIYLSNLAVADLMLVSFLPFWAVNILHNFNWPFGTVVCKLVNMGINMNGYCSIYLIVMVSMDRYVALVHPLSQDRFRRPKYAKMCCLLLWAFSLLMNIPIILYRKVEYNPYFNATFCFMKYPDRNVHLLCVAILSTFTFLIPISIISYCTFKIIKSLNNRLVVGHNAEHKPTTLVLAVLLAFLICWLPFHVFKIPYELVSARILKDPLCVHVLTNASQISLYLAFFNSVVNPVLYVIVGKNFRKKIWEVFTQRPFRKPSTITLTTNHTNMSRSQQTRLVTQK